MLILLAVSIKFGMLYRPLNRLPEACALPAAHYWLCDHRECAALRAMVAGSVASCAIIRAEKWLKLCVIPILGAHPDQKVLTLGRPMSRIDAVIDDQ